MRRPAFLLVIAALGLVLPRGAHAQNAGVERAQALFDVGVRAYEQGEFKGAIDAFEEAYRASPRPGLLFSIAQAQRKQFYASHDPTSLRAAIDHYRLYVAQVSSGKFRVIAVDALGELEAVAGKMKVEPGLAAAAAEKPRTRVMVSSVEGARIALDDMPFVPSPLIADVTPTKHSIRIEAGGYYPDTRPLVAVEGGLVALDVPLRPRPAQLFVHAESGSDILVDRRPVGRTPLTGPIELDAGAHFIAVTRNGRRPYSEQVHVDRGESKTLDVELASTGQRVVAYVLLTGAAVAAATGGVLVGWAFYQQGQADSIQAVSGTRNISEQQLRDYTSDIGTRDSLRLAAYATFGGAVVLALGAGTLLLFDNPRAPLGPTHFEQGPTPRRPTTSPLEVSALPIAVPGFVGASLAGSF